MSEGYTQEAVVQYRHWTTSCDDYRWCLNFNSRTWSCRQDWGGAYNKMLQEYGMDDTTVSHPSFLRPHVTHSDRLALSLP
jgi:hypothetical protein